MASKDLLKTGYYRSSVSRSYYAAYSALTARLIHEQKVDFAFGRNNPAHKQLVPLLINNIQDASFGFRVLKTLKKSVIPCQRAGESVDYVPGVTMDRIVALRMIREAPSVTQTLGIT